MIPFNFLGPSTAEETENTTVTGAYNDQSDMENERGVENIRSWSAKGSDGTADLAAIARAIRYARDQINYRLRTRFTWPLVNRDGDAISTTTLEELNLISESLSSPRLYGARGLDVEDDADGSVLKAEHDEALARLDWLCEHPDAIDLQVASVDATETRAELRRVIKPSCAWNDGETW